jgi:serine/threonine-protein kinase
LDIAEDGLPFISMELVVGDTLKTLVQRAGALPVSLVLDVALHVCEALDAAHRLGLVHRDIKPENIVLIGQREGPPVAKILDFGISRLREETSGVKGLTQTGMVIGTPEYMSPEQALGKRGDDIDGRSDLYSLGIVMYRMLTGELPFKAETTVEMILQHLRTPPVPPHLAKPDLAIPEAVSAVVMKALEKDREKRFATGAEMAAAIKKSRGSITLHSRKIDWKGLSSASASFGTESPTSASSITSSTAIRLAASSPTSAGAALSEKTLYRTSARIGPPPKEFPTRLALGVLGVVLLLGVGFAGWKYSRAGTSPKPVPAPAKISESPPPVKVQNPAVIPKVEPAPVATGEQEPPEHRKLSYEEQAKVIELDSLADIDYNEGGCEKALPTYQQVLAIDPNDARAYAAVQKCYAKARNGETIAPSPTPDTSPHP